jgi:hypothetical protein
VVEVGAGTLPVVGAVAGQTARSHNAPCVLANVAGEVRGRHHGAPRLWDHGRGGRSRARNSWLVTTLVAGLAASQIACALGASRIARGGVEGGIAGSLEALEEPHNKERLRRLMQDPDIRAAAHDLSEAIAGGALDSLTEEERVRRIGEASNTYVQAISAAVGRALGEDLSPAVMKSAERVVSAAVAGALDPENQRLTRRFIDDLTRSTIAGFTWSTAQGLRDDLGPALGEVVAKDLGPAVQRVVEDNLGPAMRKVIEQDLRPAMLAATAGEHGGASGLFARVLAKQLVLGVNDGMSELGMSLSPNKQDGLGLLGWLALGLGVLLLIVSGLLVRMFYVRRSLAQERARSEELLLSVLRAIQSPTEDPNVLPDLDTVLSQRVSVALKRADAAVLEPAGSISRCDEAGDGADRGL